MATSVGWTEFGTVTWRRPDQKRMAFVAHFLKHLFFRDGIQCMSTLKRGMWPLKKMVRPWRTAYDTLVQRSKRRVTGVGKRVRRPDEAETLCKANVTLWGCVDFKCILLHIPQNHTPCSSGHLGDFANGFRVSNSAKPFKSKYEYCYCHDAINQT